MRFLRSLSKPPFQRPCTLAALVVALFVASGPTMGARCKQCADIPRLPGGKPDLSGVWQVMNRANFDIETHAARPAMALREGPFGPLPRDELVALGAVGAVPAGVGVVQGTIPYQPWAFEQRERHRERWLEEDPEVRCYLPGVPRANYMAFPFQIFHSQTSMLFAYEYAGAVRNIYLEDPGEAPVDSWMGQSYGQWDGDTFVIEVTGFNGRTWFDRSGNFHSDALVVEERYTPTSLHTMEYAVTITDEKVFTQPWNMKMTLYRRVGDDARLMQFKCVEFVEELLYGHLRKNQAAEETDE